MKIYLEVKLNERINHEKDKTFNTTKDLCPMLPGEEPNYSRGQLLARREERRRRCLLRLAARTTCPRAGRSTDSWSGSRELSPELARSRSELLCSDSVAARSSIPKRSCSSARIGWPGPQRRVGGRRGVGRGWCRSRPSRRGRSRFGRRCATECWNKKNNWKIIFSEINWDFKKSLA